MTITLEERLQRAAEVLDHEAVDVRLGPTPRPRDESPAPRSFLVQVAAACIVVIGLAGVVWAMSRPPAESPVGSAPDSAAATTTETTTAVAGQEVPTTVVTPGTIVPPAAILPELADVSTVPVTVVDSGPSDWYRLLPDLDVAWYSEGAGAPSMLCFRTPAGSACLLDEFAPASNGGGPIAVQSVGGQVLIVTLAPDPEVSITFDNGEIRTAPVEFDPQIGWGVARIQAPDASSPVGLSMLFELPSVAATTVPASDTAPNTTFVSPNTTAPPVTTPATTAAASTATATAPATTRAN